MFGHLASPPDVPVLDEARFAELSERHRRELQVHSYRMLGNLEQAEDAVAADLDRVTGQDDKVTW